MGTLLFSAEPELKKIGDASIFPAATPSSGATAPVAYLVSRFPKVTETFILRELLELVRQGQSVAIFPLLSVQQPVRQPEAERLMDAVRYTPLVSWAILRANLHYLRRSLRRYLALFGWILRGSWRSPEVCLKSLILWPKSVYLARLIAEQGIRHVHAHFATYPALAALIISELTGASFSVTVHAHDLFVDTTLLREKLARARFIVAISEFNKRLLLDRFPAISPETIQVIRCGVERDAYDRPRGARDGLFTPPFLERAGFTIVCVASLEPYKGIAHLLRACARLRGTMGPFRCLVIGEGPERPRLEALIRPLGLTDVVQLLGAKPQAEVAALLAEADCFVLPSVVAPNGRMDGIPVALMEAMAARLPVIASRLSGIPELVEHGMSGLLVEPGDEAALSEAITLLVRSPALRQSLGERARETVAETFSLSANVARLRTLFPDGSTGHGWSLEPRAVGADSEVYAVRRPEGSEAPALILKRHRSAQAASYAQREFEALSRLSEAFARRSARLRVPKPVELRDGSNELIMEACEGRRLDRLLRWRRVWRAPGAAARLGRTIQACGQWLALLHELTAHDGDAVRAAQRLERDFRRDLARCCELGLPRATALRIMGAVERHRPALSNGGALVRCHGDFGPHNVWVAPERITVIDFEGLHEGFGLEDVAYFLNWLETMPAHLGPALAQQLVQRFLDGYAPGRAVERHRLAGFQLLAMVKIMAHSTLLNTSGRTWAERWQRARLLRRYSHWLEKSVRHFPGSARPFKVSDTFSPR